MKILKYLPVLALTAQTVWADAPAPASEPGACQPGTDSSCYLNDKNGINQPLDTQTRGLAIPNRLIESDMNMFVNPGQVVNYGTAYLEGWLGANLVWGGATVPLPANQKLAIFLRRPLNLNSPLGSTETLFNKYAGQISPAGFLNGGGSLFTGDVAAAPGTSSLSAYSILDKAKKGFGNVDLMYGIALGKINLGLRLSYANIAHSQDKTDSTANYSARFATNSHNIGAGLGAQVKDFGPGYLDFALSTDIPITKLEYSNQIAAGSENIAIKSTTPFSLGVLTRYVMPVGQDKIILAVNVDTFKVGHEIRGVNTTAVQLSRDASASMLNVQFDAAYHQSFQEGKLKIIYSAGVGSTRATYKIADNNSAATLNSAYEVSNFFIPLGVAAEHKTFESLRTRIGLRKNVISNKTITDTTVTTSNTTKTSFYADDELLVAMGLGWTPAEKVQLDFAMNANAFNLNTFFSAVSARYHY
jgi:hypothetical protein